MKLVFDIETDDLNASKIWCIVAIDEDNKGCDYLNQAVQANYSGEGSLTVYNRFCLTSP